MNFLPIFLDTSTGIVALAGSSHAAVAKLRLLRAAGAHVRWYPCAAEVDDEILRSAPGTGTLDVSHHDPVADDLSGVVAMVASAGKGIDEKLSQRLRGLGIPINVVDRMDLSTFIFPAIVDRGDVVVAIGTGGTSPVIARRLREKIEALLPARIGELSNLIGRYRARFVAARREISARVFWERIIDGPVGALALAGRTDDAEAQLVAAIDAADAPQDGVGIVHLVGAGPGDPDLLTLKAAQALADADVVFYDDLVAGEILDRARRDADRIFVGKRRGHPGTPQDEINAMMVEAARGGKRVVRLKGGDPFIFGRGGEELEALRDAEIPVVVVPGITAALGCAAEAGLPLTFRNEATQLAIITAHRADAAASIDWKSFANPKITVAVYMGLQSAAAVRDGLLAAGRTAQTPVAVLSRGTRADSKALVGRLDNLPALAASAGNGPALLVIGDVVARSDAWRALKPLIAQAA